MTYIHLADNFDKVIDKFHDFKIKHIDDIVTTNYDSVSKSIFLTLHNGDAHDFIKRSPQLVFDRLSELGCRGFTVSESDVRELDLIRICETTEKVHEIFDAETTSKIDFIGWAVVSDSGRANIKFKDGTYEIIIPLISERDNSDLAIES